MNDYERIEKVIRHLKEHYVEQPDFRELARIAKVSEFHFHRLFSRWAGVTPKSFVKFLTAQHAKALLRESQSVLDASLDAGLSGPGRLHDLLVSVDAVSPGEFKNYGAGMEIRYGFHPTPFGTCLIGATSRGICHLSFLDGDGGSAVVSELKSDWPKAVLRRHPQSTHALASRIFERGGRAGKLPVLLVGTPFRLKVWEALLKIPSGRVLSYRDIARSIGDSHACRAVGAAVGANPVAYLIPCHRVIHETGIVGNYRWGQARKLAMLAWENGSQNANEARAAAGGLSLQGARSESARF
ncbi:MAG TPA: methylated-DNA--[protein]-cysteine S-methyltransferase [Candidatus Binatia bacterium]|jgi:AraC family transcriptional regulator of adaptative response/methylated-DNA-[protein]-cysteine methyltransferase